MQHVVLGLRTGSLEGLANSKSGQSNFGGPLRGLNACPLIRERLGLGLLWLDCELLQILKREREREQTPNLLAEVDSSVPHQNRCAYGEICLSWHVFSLGEARAHTIALLGFCLECSCGLALSTCVYIAVVLCSLLSAQLCASLKRSAL